MTYDDVLKDRSETEIIRDVLENLIWAIDEHYSLRDLRQSDEYKKARKICEI